MATSKDVLKQDSLWRDRPCHFTWNLSASFINYDNIVRKLDYDLVETKNLLFVEKLLFRAFLEVSDHRENWNASKAREFLDRADICIAKQTQLQNGFRSVALLNRLHIEYKTQNYQKVEDLLLELQELKLDEKDRLVIGAVKAAALTRFGPTVRDDAILLFEEASEYFPNNPGFLFGALLMKGRKVRFERHIGDKYDDLEADGKELMDTEKKYCERLMDINDEYQLGRSFLGQNLSRRGSSYTEEARAYLEEAFKKAPKVIAVFHNLVRFYRNVDVNKAVVFIQTTIKNEPCLHVAESHHQLALCFNSKANRFRLNKREKDKWKTKTLNELDTCLQLDSMHFIASMRKAIVLTKHRHNLEAEKLYENLLLQSEKMSIEIKFSLYVDYARFLTKASSPKKIDAWRKVMEMSSSFEYQDFKTGRWAVKRRIKKDKEEAYKILSDHCEENPEYQIYTRGILYLQQFDFEKAVDMFNRLNPQTNQTVPFYLSEVYFKWGIEQEASASIFPSHMTSQAQTALTRRSKEDLSLAKSRARRVLACTFPLSGLGNSSGHCKVSTVQLEKAHDCYKLARDNSKLSTKLGLNLAMGRKLLADIALSTAHLHLRRAPIRHAQESECIYAYREAIRCGSLVACLEILRLHHEGYIEIISRSKFLQILAEIDVCCSQPFSDCLHRELKPRSFKNGPDSQSTDNDFSALNCKTIRREIYDTLRENGFFREVWKAHFDMEKKVLEETFNNNKGELELDGREGLTQVVDKDTIYTAIDCCAKLRPLLDHIVLQFEKDELVVEEGKKRQYFPLVLGERDPVLVEQQLQGKLISYFEINFKHHYPKLYKQLLGIQPGWNTKYDFLEQFWSLVNHVKHKGTELTELPDIEQYIVTLTRHCTDTVEDICNFFFDAMKESSELRDQLGHLVTDLKRSLGQDMHEMYEKADQLLFILLDHPDLVTRVGTWKVLEMLALIKHAWTHSKQNGGLDDELTKTIEGTWDPSQNLRRSHFAVELALLRTDDPNSKDTLEKCRETCKEADTLLASVLLKNIKGEGGGSVVQFPFKDVHPSRQQKKKLGYNQWRKNFKRQLKKDVSQMGITATHELLEKLLEIIIKAQPFSKEDNYNFIALRDFIVCKSENIPNRVFIETLDRHVPIIDLTRWCVDHAEKIAAEVDDL